MAGSEFLNELERFLPVEMGKKLAACRKAATARISESGRSMAANLGRILPTGPRRMSQTLFLQNEFSRGTKALPLPYFSKLSTIHVSQKLRFFTSVEFASSCKTVLHPPGHNFAT